MSILVCPSQVCQHRLFASQTHIKQEQQEGLEGPSHCIQCTCFDTGPVTLLGDSDTQRGYQAFALEQLYVPLDLSMAYEYNIFKDF
jgi:hypothetical protein